MSRPATVAGAAVTAVLAVVGVSTPAVAAVPEPPLQEHAARAGHGEQADHGERAEHEHVDPSPPSPSDAHDEGAHDGGAHEGADDGDAHDEGTHGAGPGGAPAEEAGHGDHGPAPAHVEPATRSLVLSGFGAVNAAVLVAAAVLGRRTPRRGRRSRR